MKYIIVPIFQIIVVLFLYPVVLLCTTLEALWYWDAEKLMWNRDFETDDY